MNSPDVPSAVEFRFEAEPDHGCVTEVADGIWWLAVPLRSSLKSVNAYILADEDGWTLIDTGVNSAECRKLFEEVFHTPPFANKPLKRVIVTHFHPDHIGLAGELVQLGVRFQCSRICWHASHRLWADQPDAPVPAHLEFMQRAGMSGLEFEALQRNRPKNYCDSVARPPKTYEKLCEGEVISIGKRKWKVVMGYGHAEEHVALWSDDDVALVGDQILPSISPNLSVHYTNPDEDPIRWWIASCEKFAEIAKPTTLCLPGHGRPFVKARGRCHQLKRNCEQVIERLHTHLARPSTAMECLQTVYRRPLEKYERSLLIAETVGYLNHLRATGRCERILMKSQYYLWRTKKK